MSQDIVKQIRKATRRQFTADEKIRIVLEGLRGEAPDPSSPDSPRPGLPLSPGGAPVVRHRDLHGHFRPVPARIHGLVDNRINSSRAPAASFGPQ